MSEVLIERPEDGIAVVRLNRPEAKNALNLALRRKLHDAFLELSDDADVRAIVLTGSREVFAAGADLKEFADLDLDITDGDVLLKIKVWIKALLLDWLFGFKCDFKGAN